MDYHLNLTEFELPIELESDSNMWTNWIVFCIAIKTQSKNIPGTRCYREG